MSLSHDPRFLAMTNVHLQTLIRANIETMKEVVGDDRGLNILLDQIGSAAKSEADKSKLQIALVGLMKASDALFQRKGFQMEAIKEALTKVHAGLVAAPKKEEALKQGGPKRYGNTD
jgi:hypothetical protein